jgi:hypothetical protein
LPNADSLGDGIADGWAVEHFGNVNVPGAEAGADWDADRMSNLEEFAAGTDPKSLDDRFTLYCTVSNGAEVVSFETREAVGPSYEGRTRTYALEASTTLVEYAWNAFAGATNLPATGESVTVTNPIPAPVFFRGSVRMEPLP